MRLTLPVVVTSILFMISEIRPIDALNNQDKNQAPFNDKSIQHVTDLCKLFAVPLDKCSCNIFNRNFTGMDPKFCQITTRKPALQINIKDAGNAKAENPKLRLNKNSTWQISKLQRLCEVFNISSDNCTCERFKTKDNNTFVNVCATTPTKRPNHSAEVITGVPVITSIEDVCRLFGIPLSNCSCDKFTINGTSEFPDLCSLTNGKTKVTLVYTASLSRSYASITIIASTVGIIGNLAVIFIAYRNRKSLPRCKTLIAFLAGSDLLFAVIQFILVIPLFWTNKWIYGGFMCKFLRSGITLGALVSISLILIIAIERYCGILYSLQKKVSDRLLNIIVAAVLVVTVASVVPLYVVIDVHPEAGHCGEQWSNKLGASLIYNWFLMIIFFILPVAVISYLYARVVLHLRKQMNSNLITDERGMQKRIKENKRIMLILITILVAFVVCVLPNRIAWIYFDTVKYKMSREGYLALSYVALLTFPLHVAVNPIIYSVVDKAWRSDVIQLFSQKKRRASSTGTSCSTIPDKINHKDDTSNSYGSIFNKMKHKDDKGRHSSVDHSASLLSHQLSIAKSDIDNPVGDDNVFQS